MTEDESMSLSIEEVRDALRSLERDGFVVSKLCHDGHIRWFPTTKPYCEYARDDADDTLSLLN